MALIIKDRIKEGTTSIGTGSISLGGSAATFNTFGSVMSNGDTTYYAIVHTSTGVDEWEVGIGTYDSTLNEIARTTVLSGSSGTSAVNFSSGVKDVFVTYPAEKAIYYDGSGNVTFGADASVTGDLILGGYIDLNVFADGSEPAHNEGRIFYQEEYGTLSVYNGESDITLQVGQEEWIRVYNNTGSTITNGTPVYITGAVSETPAVAPADATTLLKSDAIGIATHDIEASTVGFVTARGLVSGIDTSGLTVGSRIHIAADGTLQNAAPTYPYFPTDIGYCIISDATNGYIYVTVREHTFEQLRITGNQHIDGNLNIDGNLTITGTQSITSQASLSVDDSFIYMNSGNTIGAANTSFSGTGLDDGAFTGHYEGTTSQTFYVRIDGVGTGTGGVDTFEWSLDNFTSTQATGVDCSTTGTDLTDGITITFNSETGHTSGDVWSGTAAPVNVDSGTFSNRNTGASGVGYTHMGWFYDVSTNKFTFLDAYDPEPEGTIDLGDASVNYATIKAGTFEGDFTGDLTGNVTGNVTGSLTGNVTGNVTGSSGSTTGNAATATSLATARTIQLSGDVTGSVTFDGTADVNITAAVTDDSHAHIISNVDGLQTALDGKVDTTRTITAGNGFAAGSGGDLSVNRSFTIGGGTGVTVNANDIAIGQDVATTATPTFAGATINGNIAVTGTVDGRDIASDGSKLDGIESGATADQTAAEILTAIKTVDGAGSGLDADTLDGVQASGFATAAQGTTADAALARSGGTMTGAITFAAGQTFDGRDVSADGAKLDGIESGATADQTASEILTLINTVDGSGSGLDADLLDGVQASSFLRSDADDTFSGRVLEFGIAGNGSNTSGAFLSVEGNTDSSGEGSGRLFFREHNSTTASADNYGVSIGYRGGGTSVTTAVGNTWTGLSQINNGEWGMWGHDNSLDGVLIAHGPRTGAYADFTGLKVGGSNVWHTGNDGSGSGLDADLLDGIHGSSLLRSDVDDNLTAAIIVPSANRDEGIFGTYDSTKTQHIWSMGTAYRNNSAGTNFGNLYGLAYKHTNNSTGGTMAGGHQMVWCQNGTGYAAMGSNIWTSGNVTAYSDIRVKTNLEVIPDAVEKVKKLNGYTFDRTDVNYDDNGIPTVPVRQAGVVAQEVLDVLPEVVTGGPTESDPDGHYAVAYGNIVALLIEAIKEQQQQIDELKAKLEGL